MILAFANIILYLNSKSVVAKGKVGNSDSLRPEALSMCAFTV